MNPDFPVQTRKTTEAHGGIMLTFEEKLEIIESSFPELTRKDVSLGRVNFHYEEAVIDKKNVVYHLHPNGNGYVFGDLIEGYPLDERGMVNIRDFSSNELRKIIGQSIQSLSVLPGSDIEIQTWVNDEDQTLELMYEPELELWNVYAGDILDGTFPSRNEAVQYLDEEGFTRR